MIHNRKQVIERTKREFDQLDKLVAGLSDDEWRLPVPRPESKDPWTIKDSLAHITHWKADVIRSAKGEPRPPEEQGLGETDGNRLVYLRWRDRSPQEVLAWHRQVQKDVLAALDEVSDKWFTGRQRREEWPFDLDGHSSYHRAKDIEMALKKKEQKHAG